MYSPLVVNGVENSNQDYAHILGSEKTGATPGQMTLNRQTSGPAVVSEFNPLNDNQAALENPQVIKNDQNNAIQQVLVDNFLKTQNLLNLAPGGKLLATQEMKSMPSSPSTQGALGVKNRARQLQVNNNGPLLNNKNRRLTTSVSSTNIPEFRNQNFTPKSCYSSVR
mmetsp:Transcript_37441/g.49228  ORF Transcript_37441/g.49228 Transcript_37441/m.49228 type:complete len:167 (+) Transcript_37441:1550-2050(+)